jgi:hypothetical protein
MKDLNILSKLYSCVRLILHQIFFFTFSLPILHSLFENSPHTIMISENDTKIFTCNLYGARIIPANFPELVNVVLIVCASRLFPQRQN